MSIRKQDVKDVLIDIIGFTLECNDKDFKLLNKMTDENWDSIAEKVCEEFGKFGFEVVK